MQLSSPLALPTACLVLIFRCVQKENYPYKYVTVESSLVAADRPPTHEQMLAIARRYLPEPAAAAFVASGLDQRTGELVLFTVRPDRWATFDFAGDLD